MQSMFDMVHMKWFGFKDKARVTNFHYKQTIFYRSVHSLIKIQDDPRQLLDKYSQVDITGATL